MMSRPTFDDLHDVALQGDLHCLDQRRSHGNRASAAREWPCSSRRAGLLFQASTVDFPNLPDARSHLLISRCCESFVDKETGRRRECEEEPFRINDTSGSGSDLLNTHRSNSQP